MTDPWTPELRLHACGTGVRLSLIGITHGDGETLQEASNDLMARLFDVAVAFRAGGYRMGAAAGHRQAMEFLWEIGEIAARGGDIRARVLGIPSPRRSTD